MSVMKRLASAALVALGLSVFTERVARADRNWDLFLPVGGVTGYSFHPERVGNGAVLGGEASLVFLHNDNLTWLGGYVDAVHDFGPSATRISIGPELGKAIFGIDGGFVLSTYGGPHAGVCGRFLISLAVLHLYTRVGTIFDSPKEGTYGELGVMLKIPIPIDKDWPWNAPRPPPRPPPPPPSVPLQQEGPSLPIAAPPPETEGGR